MPKLLLVRGIRFFFYSNEMNEPPHVHVVKGDAYGKIWVDPLEIKYLIGFTLAEKRLIIEIVKSNIVTFKARWNAHLIKK